jgi:hypothetical protein
MIVHDGSVEKHTDGGYGSKSKALQVQEPWSCQLNFEDATRLTVGMQVGRGKRPAGPRLATLQKFTKVFKELGPNLETPD